MKLIILSMVLCGFLTTVSGQDLTPKQDWKETDLYKKSRRQKTAAWIFSGTGTAGLLVTLVADVGQAPIGFVEYLRSEEKPVYKSYTGAYLFSAACLATGIYFFVASSINKNKAKAASVFINMENAPVLQGTVINYQTFPAVGVKIHL